tara:strand:+ start:18356 stop:19444 length:1089 start_codon:yes stop_codon:yes gene_type:complete
MQLAFHLPVNSVSFGQLSLAILREAYRRGLEPCLFPVGDVDPSAQKSDPEFEKWLKGCLEKAAKDHNRKNPIFKLWHLNGSLESYSEKQVLLTYYELDSPTPYEVNIAKNNAKTLFSSQYACDVFNQNGAETEYLPVGFDTHNFYPTNKKYFNDGRITFNLVGKFEKRKHHHRILKLWAEKYGDKKEYFLNCSLYNHFLSPEENSSIINQALDGRRYFNINLLSYMPQNELYNDYLNAGNIVIGMSGGEGWGLPEFQSVCLGKHSVILDCNGYKSWANADNSVLVKPNGKIPAVDGRFFQQGAPFNQGNIFDFKDEDFLEACEKAIQRVKDDPVNQKGIETGNEFSYSKTLDKILEHLESLK